MLYKFDGNQPAVGKDTYVSDSAKVIGNVIIGDNCYIGHGSILRGDYGRIEIGDGTAEEEVLIVHAPPGDTNKNSRFDQNIFLKPLTYSAVGLIRSAISKSFGYGKV